MTRGSPFMPKRPHVWARERILTSFAAERALESRRAFDDREELRFVVEGRGCLVTLWALTADIALDTAVPILPPSLAIQEASGWGHQREESLWSGEAVRAGDPAFDSAYIVLGADPSVRPSEEEARSLSPELKSFLLKRRTELRDATIEPERLKLSIPSSRQDGPPPSVEPGRARVVWALGVAFFGFRYLPSARDLDAGLDRAVALAKALEVIRA
jgi:hypothetical protein